MSEDFVRAFPHGTGEAKCAGNYAAAMLPQKLAKEQGFDQLIWLDGKTTTKIEESGTMNLFFVIDGTLLTPQTTGTILHGVTRDSVIQLAKHHGWKVEVRDIYAQEIVDAFYAGLLQEAFGAGTAATIAPIQSITYQGKRMELPPVEEAKIAPLLHQMLDAIKLGQAEDPFEWLHKI
jgi:branched-chain amino acid aminotransferase